MNKLTTETVRRLSMAAGEKKASELKLSYRNDFFDHKPLLNEEQFVSEVFGDFELDKNLCDSMIEAYHTDATEFSAGKILFESLDFLDLRNASDIGFWIHLSHKLLYRYIVIRWPFPEDESKLVTHVKNHFLFANSAQGSLIDHPLSGLWWSFHLSKDEVNKKDPYHLTKVFFKNAAFRTKYLGPSKVSRHREAVLGALEYINRDVIPYKKSIEEYGRAIARYLNLIGGTRPLAYFDRDWFYTALRDAKLELYKYDRKTK